ncbi:arp2/3 complex-activating protein rickA-like [Diorhabda sublineata]|uniref:arp2/3 complex-activating protein rickA-like n=1 Tax=Diorhabda sublineata TaxID=1163346 RepID=UPI0024E0F1F9|nr:arp2/3 complex-activating protein rickA-like [Diorhabda sublineata]
MTTVSLEIDKDRKLQYKEYVNFLDNYRSGKSNKCDFKSCSSSSSITSDNSDFNEMPTKSFKEYLQDYNNKKYQPVQPNFMKKNDEPKNVKTEVFIQINNTANLENDNQIKITIPKPKIDDIDGEKIKVSVGKLSQKFDNKSHSSNFIKRSSSITEKTKIFEEKSDENGHLINMNIKNYTEKFPKNDIASKKKINGHRQNPTFIEIRKQELQNGSNMKDLPHFKNNNSHTVQRSDPEISDDIEPIGINGNMTTPTKEPICASKQENLKLEINKSNCEIPPPPPLPPLNPQTKNEIKIITPQPKPFQSKAPSETIEPKVHPASSNPTPKISNGYSTLPKMQNQENTLSPIIDKKDPRVKKMVYGALRGMYGAYHDRANDYLATLPKNRVKKNNGLDSIISSIAAQGGLEKLSGRANPKSETEQI